MLVGHENGRINCEYKICKQTFTNKSCLKRHDSKYHKNVRFSCEYENCEKSYARKDQLKIHCSTIHMKHRYVCDYPNCALQYSHKSTLDIHILAKHKHKKWICKFPECANSFISPKSLRDHIKTKHNKVKYTCASCIEEFKTGRSLKRHVENQKCRPSVHKNSTEKIEFLEKHLADIDSQIRTVAGLISGFESFECDDCHSNK